MRHRFATENVIFRSAPLRCLKAFRIPRSQAKIRLYSAPEARCTSSPSFFYPGGTSRGRAMEDGREPAGESGAGDGQPKRGADTDKTQAGNIEGFFLKLPPGTKAPSAPPPPGPKAAAQTQSDYHNTPRGAYDGTTPVLVQMVPEIATQAADSELSGRFRGVLTMARGMVTGARANSSTSGAHIWASLLGQSTGSSPVAKPAPRAWGRMNEDEALSAFFHDPAARAADPPRHDAAAIEFKVPTTTLNRILVWAWAMAGAIQPDSESQANITARTHFRQLAHRARDFTTRYADILTQAVESDATPSATPQPRESTTPAYGGPPKTVEALLERHKSPPQVETVTQTQAQDGQATAAAGGRNKPGWSFTTIGGSTNDGVSTTAGTARAHPPTTTGQANEHGGNADHDEGGGDSGSGAANIQIPRASAETIATTRCTRPCQK